MQPSPPTSSKTLPSPQKEALYPLNGHSPPPSPWPPPFCRLSLWICLLCVLHINGIIKYETFYLASVTHYNVFKVQAAAGISPALVFMVGITHRMFASRFVYPASVDGHVGCYYLLATNSAAVSMCDKLVCGHVFLSLGDIPRRAVAGFCSV